MWSQSMMEGEGNCWTAGSMEAPGGIVLDGPSGFSPYSPYLHSSSPSQKKGTPEVCSLSHIHPSISPLSVHGTQWSPGYSGSLSIHEYRKHLSQQGHTAILDKPRGRMLKRKAGTLNLNQTRTWTDFSLPSSPVSSAPSSPPPLSFSQSLVSVISQQSDRDTANIFSPFSPSSFSNSRDLSLVSNRSVTRRDQNTGRKANFRDRLERISVTQEAHSFSHRKSVSDSILLDIKKSNITVLHEGAAFEILNPRDSLRLSRIVSTPEEARRESSGSAEEKTLLVLSGDVRSSMSSDQAPSISPANALSEETQRRPTPMRSLFDDLPTAYSHITGDYSPLMATYPSGMDIRNPIISPLGNRGRKPHSDASQYHSADSQADEQMGKTKHVSNVDEPNIGRRRLSKSSSTSAKSMASDFARLLLQRPKRAGRAKDRLSNFFFPRSKLDHEESTRKRLSRSTEDRPLSSLSQQQAGKRDDADAPAHMSPLAESMSSLNLRQPNYHSARGRIDKSSTINEIVQQNSRIESIDRPRERPVTLFPDPFRHHRQVSSPGSVPCESRKSQIQSGVISYDSSQEIDVGCEERRNLVGDEVSAPLPSICGRLESQHGIQKAENPNLHSAILVKQSSEWNGTEEPEVLKSCERESPGENPRQVTDTGLSAPQPEMVSHPLAENTRGSGTFIPYASSTGTLGAFVSGQFRGLPRSTHGPNSAVSMRQTLPSNIEENANQKTREETVRPGEYKETSHSTNNSSYLYPYESQSATDNSQIHGHGTFQASLSQAQDLGPGGSQSSSSQQLSEPSLSPLLRPHLRLLSGLRSLRSRTVSHGGVSNNYSRLGQRQSHVFRSRESEAMQDDEQDWETIPESEQFSINTFDTFVGQGAHRSGYANPYTPRLGQAVTGSSLADYSSHGSLAQEETSSWTPFDLSSPPPPSQLSPLFHPHYLGQANIHEPYYGSDVGPSAYRVLNTDSPLNANALLSQAPPLLATTDDFSGPLRPHSARTYRHPTPLGGSHTNPFLSSPPSIPRGAGACPDRPDPVSGQASRVGGTNHYSKFSFLEYSHITEDADLQTSFETLGKFVTHPDERPLPSGTPSLDTSPLHKIPSNASSGWVTIRSTQENPAVLGIPLTVPYRDQLLTQTSRSRPGHRGRLSYPPSHGRRITGASSNDADNTPAGAPLNQAAVQLSSTEQVVPGPSGKPTPVKSIPGSLYQSIRARHEKGQNQRQVSNEIELQAWQQRSLRSSNRSEAPHGQGKSADMATAFSRSSLKHGTSTAALLAGSERSRTTLNSTAGTSANRTKRYRTDAEVRERLRILDNISAADIARPRTAITFPSSSRLPGDEESAGSYLPWYRSSSGRYVFTEPPRLMQLPPRYSEASIMPSIVIQKHHGRRLLACLTLLFPFGWVVVTLISLGVSWPDRIIKWCSGGLVESFHDRERILARWMTLGYILVLIGAIISLFMALFSR